MTLICAILVYLVFAGTFGRVWCPWIIIVGVLFDAWLALGYIVVEVQERKKREKEEKEGK